MSARVFLVLLLLHAAVPLLFLWDGPLGFPLDDTWVHMVYARAFSQGAGFAYNPAEHATGLSAPLWTALLALPVGLADALDVRPDVGVRLLGGVLGLAMACAGYVLAGRAGRWPGAFAALVLSLEPTLVFERFSGMEQPLFGLLLLLLMGALLNRRESRAGLLCGLLVLTRPEALAVAVVGGVWLFQRRCRVVRFAVPVAACLVPWMAYCQIVSGVPWPSTFENKLDPVLEPRAVIAAVGALFSDSGWGWALPLAAVVGIFSLEGGRRYLGTLPAIAGIALFAGTLLTRPLPVMDDPARVPYYWARYGLLAWPLLVLPASAGIASLTRTAYAGTRCRPLFAAVLIGPLLVIAFTGYELPLRAPALAARFAAECGDIETLNVAAGRWIDEHLPVDALVATHDAGAVRFFGGRRVLDVWGNNSPALQSRDRAGGEQAAIEWIRRQRPDALAVFPALYARDHSPELNALWQELPPQEFAALRDTASDYAELLGLTRRAASFHVDTPTAVPSPLHADFAVFVRP